MICSSNRQRSLIHGRLLWLLVAFACWVAPAPARAQVQTFFVQTPADDSAETCASRFTGTLVNYGTFRAQQDPTTQRAVSECLGAIAGTASQRECALSMANIDVDFLIRLKSNRIGDGWNWTVDALSPSQGAAQVWGGSDIAPDQVDRSQAAYQSCEYLAMKFACTQETNQGCADSQAFEAERRRVARAKAKATVGATDPPPLPGPGPTPRPPEPEPEPDPVPVIDPRISGWVLVTGVFPSDATVAVDGTIVGTGNGEYAVVAGQRRVVISAPGFEDVQQVVKVSVGAIETIEDVTLKKVPSFLQTRAISPPEAAILVDGERVGVGAGRFEIREGDHTVTIAARGYTPVERKIRAAQGSTSIVEGITLARAPTRLTVEVTPIGALTLLDGAVVLTGSGTVMVTPGKHRVEITAPGYRSQVDEITFEVGIDTEILGVDLKVIPAILEVTSDEDASEVWLDARLIGTVDSTAPKTFTVTPGRHELTVGRIGHEPYRQEVDLKAGANPRVYADLAAWGDYWLGYSQTLGFGSSFVTDIALNPDAIAEGNGVPCDSNCTVTWNKAAVHSGAHRFEFRWNSNEQRSGPGFEYPAVNPTGTLYVQLAPDVPLTIEGLEPSQYDPGTGNYTAAKSVTRRVVWSRTSLGVVIMSPRDGFDLDLGVTFGLHLSDFGGLSQLAGHFGPRAELYLPVTDVISLKAGYEFTFGSYGEDVLAETDDAESVVLAQSLSLGLDFAF